MSLTLELSPKLEQQLREEAKEQGLSLNHYALKLLEEKLVGQKQQDDAVDLIQSWIDKGDADEQKATGEFLIQSLNEDRLSERKLFPEELRNVSW